MASTTNRPTSYWGWQPTYGPLYKLPPTKSTINLKKKKKNPLVYIENLIRPPISLPFSQVALVLGLFCTPIKQNLAHLTFKYLKVQTLHNKISIYQPILNLKKPTPQNPFTSYSFFLFYGTLTLPIGTATIPQNSASVLTIPKKKKNLTNFFFLLAF